MASSCTASGAARATTSLASRASISNRSSLGLITRPAVGVRRSTAFQCRASGQFEVEFSLPDGSSKTVSCNKGDVLRDVVMAADDVELYTTWGKMMSCGGYGQCGTCAVQVLEGMDLLPAERSQPETKHLKKKPETWRLACQCTIGDDAEGGKLKIQTLPKK